MTDRINSLFVTLEKDIREDDCQALISAIGMLKGVLRVDANITDGNLWVAESRAKHELTAKIYEALK